jgi:hypothetical protein
MPVCDEEHDGEGAAQAVPLKIAAAKG